MQSGAKHKQHVEWVAGKKSVPSPVRTKADQTIPFQHVENSMEISEPQEIDTSIGMIEGRTGEEMNIQGARQIRKKKKKKGNKSNIVAVTKKKVKKSKKSTITVPEQCEEQLLQVEKDLIGVTEEYDKKVTSEKRKGFKSKMAP